MTQERNISQDSKGLYVEQGSVVVNYGEKKIPKNLTKPPFLSEVFIGRKGDITAIHQQLLADNPLLLLINGQGGIGKTTLAAHYYQTYRDDYQHLAWVFAENSLRDAILTLALPLQVNFPKNMPIQQRFAHLLAAMADLKHPCLLIIDNANNLADLKQYYQALRSCPNFHILLTTRITEFNSAACYKITALEKPDSINLFKQHYPKHLADEDGLLENILLAIGYNTLVIELLAKYLRQINRLKIHCSLSELLSELQHKGLLAVNGKTVDVSYHAKDMALRQETPESIIAAMYDLSQLSDAETALLSVFAVLPAENIAYSILETLLVEVEYLDTLLLSLAQKGWLENEEDSNFKVSPVVQEITRQKNQQRLMQDCDALITNLIDELDYEPSTGHFINTSYELAVLFARYADSVTKRIEAITDNIATLYV